MNITTIIPIHEYNEKIATLLDKAIESVQKQEGISELPEVIVVSPLGLQGLIEYCSKYNDTLKLRLINHESKTDYQSQVNYAVKKITTDYFSVLEFDD